MGRELNITYKEDKMGVMIHPTAIVNPDARLEDGVEIGAYSIIGENVEIDQDTKIGPHVSIEGWTRIGKRCRILQGTVIGTPAQDVHYGGGRSFVEIGDNNLIREYVTIHRGTKEDSTTHLGNNNFLMAYSHIAHNCWVGDRVVIANMGTLAGYVRLEDRTILGGLSAVHQYVRVGKYAMIGGCTKVVKDIIPYTIADGRPASLRGLNVIGLRRANISPAIRDILKRAYKILFRSRLNTTQALEKIENELEGIPEIKYLCSFIRSSQRGICKEKNNQCH